MTKTGKLNQRAFGKIFSAACASALLACALTARASADLTVSASADKTQVALNDSVRLLVTIAGDAASMPQPQMPDLSAFSVYPSGQAQNVSFVNGKMSSSVNFTYMLSPKSLGKFTIGPFSATLDGKTAQSQPIAIEVVPAGQAAPAPAAGGAQGNAAQGNRQAPGAFVKLSLDKPKAYVNEQVTMAFRFYYRVRMVANPNYQPPDTSGFLTEDLPPPRNFTESVGGVPYNVTEIKTALFPARDGALTLSPAQLKIAVQDFSGSQEDIFQQFFGGGAREYMLKSDPAKLTAVPLPSGKPDGFSGGVGEFNVAIMADKRKASVGEPLTLTLTISGKGNIKALGDPVFPEFDGFRKYDTASSLNIEKSKGFVEGSKVYKIVLVPQTSGTHNIAPIKFSYFNLPGKSYKTLTTQALSIEVAPGKSQTFAIGPGSMAPQIANVSREISYIKQEGELKPFRWLNKTPLFLILHLLPALGLLAGIGRRVRLAWIARDPERRRASGALGKWNAAVKSIRTQDADATGRIFQAFQDYFADKMLSRETSLSSKSVAAFLEAHAAIPGTAATLKSRLQKIWSEFELASYAPAQFRTQDADRLLGEARNLIEEIDSELRKSMKSVAKGGDKKKSNRLAAILLPFFIPLLIAAGATIAQSQNSAQSPADAFKEANNYYQSGQFENARALYESLAMETGPNFAVEYNLGNTYQKLGMNGKAIAHWLRARRMKPADADLKSNLQLVGVQTGETFEPESFLTRMLYRAAHILNLNQLSILYLMSFWGLCIYWTLILFSGNSLFRARAFLALAFFIMIGAWWIGRVYREQVQTEAVITQQSAEVRSGPGQRFRVGFTVPEGRRVLILNERDDAEWTEIGIPKAGVRGWIGKNAFEKI